MKSVYNFVVTPKGNRYNNIKKVGDSELILNTEIFNHQYVNREAVVVSTPIVGNTDIKPGDTVIVHHNVFRRWHDVKGVEKNSRGFLNEEEYLASPEQIYMYDNSGWSCTNGYTFVKPIKSKDNYSNNPERPLVGIVKYSDGSFLPTQLVGFTPSSEYEFIIEGKRLYRVLNKFITIKYEYQGNEKEYNPSWA